MFIKISSYPALTGSKTIASKSAEYEEARLKSTARKSPIGLTNI
ncbi:spermidine/putrescine ABC transporter ATP-binding protein [Bacillus toyonensis]|nr:spermidine/putrescine ABC transporter ATP-binding protein [Bacillus toyonensis]QWI34845.1 spermidine/putrescine ABC transporter ATP-binding protein [Bacillus toyonensis]